MSYHHIHQIQDDDNRTKLLITMMLNLVITSVEIVGGIVSGSLSLLSDALHNLSDGFSSFISYIAISLSKKKHNEKKTFGYRRSTILAALINSIILVVISVYLLEKAYFKFFNPQHIDGLIVMWVAFIGLLANTIGAYILHKNSKNDLNIKSTYLHLLSDALSSIAVVVGGILIYFFHIYWLDSVLTALIGIYVLVETYKLIKETINIVMQGVPKNINVQKLQNIIEKQDHIANVHHLHVWSLDEKNIFLEAHVELKQDLLISKTSDILNIISEELEHRFNINHVTLQFEWNTCDEKTLIQNTLG